MSADALLLVGQAVAAAAAGVAEGSHAGGAGSTDARLAVFDHDLSLGEPPAQLLAEGDLDTCGDAFTVDQHTVAVEYDEFNRLGYPRSIGLSTSGQGSWVKGGQVNIGG